MANKFIIWTLAGRYLNSMDLILIIYYKMFPDHFLLFRWWLTWCRGLIITKSGKVFCKDVAKPSCCIDYSGQVLMKPLHRVQCTAFTSFVPITYILTEIFQGFFKTSFKTPTLLQNWTPASWCLQKLDASAKSQGKTVYRFHSSSIKLLFLVLQNQGL